MALQGTLDTFALADLVRLLATTSKTGALVIDGDRGTGRLWFAAGQLTDCEPVEGDSVDALFELLRFEEGSFAFETDIIAPEGAGTPEDAIDALVAAEARLEAWRPIEAVVPSPAVLVTLRSELGEEEVRFDRDQWRVVSTIAGGTTAAALAVALDLDEVSAATRIKDLVDLGVAEVGPEVIDEAAAAVPSPTGDLLGFDEDPAPAAEDEPGDDREELAPDAFSVPIETVEEPLPTLRSLSRPEAETDAQANGDLSPSSGDIDADGSVADGLGADDGGLIDGGGSWFNEDDGGLLEAGEWAVGEDPSGLEGSFAGSTSADQNGWADEAHEPLSGLDLGAGGSLQVDLDAGLGGPTDGHRYLGASDADGLPEPLLTGEPDVAELTPGDDETDGALAVLSPAAARAVATVSSAADTTDGTEATDVGDTSDTSDATAAGDVSGADKADTADADTADEVDTTEDADDDPDLGRRVLRRIISSGRS